MEHGGVSTDLRQGIKEIEFLADPTVGKLRIGCHTAMMEGFLPIILNRLHRNTRGSHSK